MIFDLGPLLSGFLGACITAVLGYFTVVRKARTDETAIALNAWKELLDPLTKQLAEAKQEIESLRKELAERDEKHRIEVDKLVEQLRKLRLEVEKYKK